MPNITIQRASESNSILSYITPWLGRVLIIVIIIVIIVAVIKILGGGFGPLNDIFGLAGAIAKTLEDQLQACGGEPPDSTTCTKTSDCVNSTCINGSCQQCQNDKDCKKIGDNYTCQNNKMCKAPGGFGGFFNSGCFIGPVLIGFLAISIFGFFAKMFFRNSGKSKLAISVEAVTGEDATEGLPYIEIQEKAKEVCKQKTEDEIEKRQANARNGTEGKKLPYQKEDGKWYDENGNEIDANTAEARISKFRTTYEESLRPQVIKSSINRNITRNGLNKAKTLAEANKLRTDNAEAQAKTKQQADEEAENDSDMPDGEAIEEAADSVVDPIG